MALEKNRSESGEINRVLVREYLSSALLEVKPCSIHLVVIVLNTTGQFILNTGRGNISVVTIVIVRDWFALSSNESSIRSIVVWMIIFASWKTVLLVGRIHD